MLWISLSRWNRLATNRFVQKRVWLRGYIWTPLVIVKFRCQAVALTHSAYLTANNKSEDVYNRIGVDAP